MNDKVCVCIEGQIRGAKRCGPTIQKYLIDRLNADLYIIAQKYEKHDDQKLKCYGNAKKIILYDNPIPSFEKTFDDLCETFNYDKSIWRETFSQIPNEENYKLGFDKPGTCIRRMYNRYLIYNELKNCDYDWFIILRSDLYFVDDFYDVSQLKIDCLNIHENGGWGGYNNNLIAFSKYSFENVLNYIQSFLNGKMLHYYLNINNIIFYTLNEEKFFALNMMANDVEINYIKNMWYISADETDEYTTWASIKQINGDYYKYDYDYFEAQDYINNKKN
jgi:hypothetical protein